MSEINKNLQQFKPKWCKFAIASLLIPCVSIIGSFCFILLTQHNWVYPHPPFQIFLYYLIFAIIGLFVIPWLPVVSFILGILSFILIKLSRGLRKGYFLAFLGILISMLAFCFASAVLGTRRPEARLQICQYNMIELHKAIMTYNKTHNNRDPAANEWCDLLAEQKLLEKSNFLCPEYAKTNKWNKEQPYKCFYAINPNVEPNSAPDVVLLFETKDGWNQFGGPELMVFDNHYRKGCNVLFNDGYTEFIKPKRKDKLNWGK